MTCICGGAQILNDVVVSGIAITDENSFLEAVKAELRTDDVTLEQG